jgi:hypothetical protein
MPAFRMPFKPQTGTGAADQGQFGTCSAVFKHRHTPLAPKPLEGAHTATAVNICDAVRDRHRSLKPQGAAGQGERSTCWVAN